MKRYLVNEEELREIARQGFYGITNKIVKDFLNSKKPVEIIAEGEVELDSSKFFSVGAIYVDNLLGKILGKSGTLIFIPKEE